MIGLSRWLLPLLLLPLVFGHSEEGLAETPLVTGRVLLPDGSPAADLTVHLSWDFWIIPPVEQRVSHRSLPARNRLIRFLPTVRTDAEGRYRFVPDPEDRREMPAALGARFRVSAVRDDLIASALSSREPVPPIAMPDLRLAEGAKIRVRVVTAEARPIPGVVVKLRASRDDHGDVRLLQRRTDDAGAASLGPIRKLPDWTLDLQADHPRHPLEDVTIEMKRVLEGEETTIVLPTGGVMKGLVQWSFGGARSKVQVVPAERVNEKWRSIYSRTVRTDHDGRFELTGLRAGSVRLLLFPGLKYPAGSKGAHDAKPVQLRPRRIRPGQVLDLGTIECDARGR